MFGWFRRASRETEMVAALESMVDLLEQSSEMLEAAEQMIVSQRGIIESHKRVSADSARRLQIALRESQTQNAEDARRIVAYQRWCREKRCVPTDADMERLSQ